MGLQMHMPFLPEGAEILSDGLAVHRTEDGWVFYNAGGPIASCASDDEAGIRAVAVQLVKLKLVSQQVVCRILGVHRTTLYRSGRRMEAEQAGTLVRKKHGPKGPHKLKPDVVVAAQALLDRGKSMQGAAREIGVDESSVRRLVKSGALRLGGQTRRRAAKGGVAAAPQELPLTSPADTAPVTADTSVAEGEGGETASDAVMEGSEAAVGSAEGSELAAVEPKRGAAELLGPTARAARDAECEAGVAVHRSWERALASMGKLAQAPPAFEPAEAVRYGGALLALPVLLDEGLLEVGESVYHRLKNGYYGLRSVLLTLAMMALLRIRTPEQLGGRAPGELGVLVGLDRTPEVKTLRRKLAEMGEMKRSTEFQGLLAARWAADDPARVGLLYVDGHVRAYHGRKHRLPKAFSQKRRMCVPATVDTWVNDRDGQPVFYVTAPANEGMLAMLDDEVLPAIAELCSDRPLTIVFDREGWSPERFQRWASKGIRVMTYRKGRYDDWAADEFQGASGRARGRRSLLLAERGVELLPGFWVREIRRLCSTGHQTPIITTDLEQSTAEAAESMFDRWTQENFFRYARQDFALDHLVTRKVDPANPNRLAQNPERKRVAKQLRAMKTKLALVEQEVGRASMTGAPELPTELTARAQQLRAEATALTEQLAVTPKRVPIGTIVPDSQLVELERERKRLTDSIKMIAYRAESTLARILRPFYKRTQDEAHAVLQSIYHASADIVPDPTNHTLLVRVHGLSTPRATRALAALCSLLTETDTKYPGTSLRMVFETVDVAQPPA